MKVEPFFKKSKSTEKNHKADTLVKTKRTKFNSNLVQNPGWIN